MKFYRHLAQIKAITFDLDDTLYDNYPVITKTTIKSHSALQDYHPALRNFTLEQYQALRSKLLEHNPEIYHNVSEWRYRAVELALINIGLSAMEAADGAKKIMCVFHRWRSVIDIPKETHQTLNALSKKVPLVSITNGNVDIEKLDIYKYFQFTLRAGIHGRAKPWQDMYYLASQMLGISPINILHVGDDLITDVVGSLRSGMQACWINSKLTNLMHFDNARLLPHIEISKLISLIALVY